MKKKKGKRGKMKKNSRSINRNNLILITRTIIIVGLLLLWDISAQKGVYNPIFTSYPSEILQDLAKFFY